MEYVDEMMGTEFISARKVAAATNMSHVTAHEILKEHLENWQTMGKK
jgi:hypothetical protein